MNEKIFIKCQKCSFVEICDLLTSHWWSCFMLVPNTSNAQHLFWAMFKILKQWIYVFVNSLFEIVSFPRYKSTIVFKLTTAVSQKKKHKIKSTGHTSLRCFIFSCLSLSLSCCFSILAWASFCLSRFFCASFSMACRRPFTARWDCQ